MTEGAMIISLEAVRNQRKVDSLLQRLAQHGIEGQIHLQSSDGPLSDELMEDVFRAIMDHEDGDDHEDEE